MKRTYKINTGKKIIDREYNYIPIRYIIAILITIFEILAIIGVIGGVLVSLAYPIYNAVVAARRKKLAPEIIRLTDELMK